MKNKAWLRVLQALGILFILISVFFIPDSYPWYYEVLTGFIGWPLFFAPKWTKLKKELGF